MNWTKNEQAAVFYADCLLPLGMANVRARVNYFDQDSEGPGYWRGIATRTGGYARIDASGAGAAALLDDLGAYWRQQGDERLLQLLPDLVDLHRRLTEAAAPQDEQSEPVTDYIYPMF